MEIIYSIVTLNLNTEGAAKLSEFSGPFSLSVQCCERLVLELSRLLDITDFEAGNAKYYANGKIMLDNRIVAQVEFIN